MGILNKAVVKHELKAESVEKRLNEALDLVKQVHDEAHDAEQATIATINALGAELKKAQDVKAKARGVLGI